MAVQTRTDGKIYFFTDGKYIFLIRPLANNTDLSIDQGEPDVSVDDLFSRAVGGLKKAMSSELRKAVEAGNDEAMYELSNVVLYKNVFGAPSPPAGKSPPPAPLFRRGNPSDPLKA